MLEHGPIEPLAENLWRVDGALPRMALRRQTIIARDAAGRLLLHNGIALGDDAMRELEALGTPTWLVVPGPYHRLDPHAYKARYPALRVHCPRGARGRVEEVVAVDGSYDEFPDNAVLRLSHVDGVADKEGVLEVRSADGTTLVFNDLVFNQPHLPGLFGLVYRWIGSSGGPRITLVSWLAFVRDRPAVKAHLARLADTPGLVRVVPAHIEPIRENAAEVLRGIAANL